MGNSVIYEYDGFNRLTDVSEGINKAEYKYNTSGLRTSKTVNVEKTDFILDGIYVIAEIRDGDVTNYIRGLCGIIYSKDKKGTKTYYVTNNHGDVTALVNSSGTIIKEYTYDEYGVETNPDKKDTNPFRYCGEYFDIETGFIYLRVRYYDPELGRFISEDPARSNANWYSYCSNSPIINIDPSGLYDRDAAVGYALEWYDETNPDYESFDDIWAVLTSLGRMRGDCANFVSQCLVAGGIKQNKNWNYKKTYRTEWHCNYEAKIPSREMTASWAQANAQYKYFSSDWAGYNDGTPLQIWTKKGMKYNIKNNNIQKGDLMFFADRKTGEIYHATIITAVTDSEIKYAAHTDSRRKEPLSDKLKDNMVYIIRIRDDAEWGYVS